MHPFARALARRTLSASLAATAIATAIVVLTDEPTNTVPMRLARLAALAPLVACLSALAVCAHARSRGELAALQALGDAPWKAGGGAEVAGWAFGAVSLVVLVSPFVDAESLFPRVTPAIDWAMDASGSVARTTGLAVFADGSIRITGLSLHSAARGPAALAAFACVAPVALCAPPWAVTPMPIAQRVGSLAASGALLIVALHLIAAERVHAAFGMLASVPLGVMLVIARRR